MITNGYCTLNDLKAWFGITTDTDDPLLETAIEAASRSIDHFCGRRFYLDSVATARTYSAKGPGWLNVDDIGGSTITVACDTDEDGIFETSLATSSFQQQPNNALALGQPITSLGIVVATTWFPVTCDGRYSVQVTAQWGWPSVPIEVKQATLILASRYKVRKDTPHGIISFGDMTAMRITPMDYDVKGLVSPLRRIAF